MEEEKAEQTEEKEEVDRFKDVFKYYKRRQPPPDLSQAIDVDSLTEVTVVPLSDVSEEDRQAAQVSGLTPPHTWTIHSLVKHPGLLVVRNLFTRAGQLAWAKRCLCELPCATNKTNLVSHGIHLSGDDTWWELCRTSEGQRSGLRHKLRWVTLGYHHNWHTKEYSADSHSEVPECLAVLCGVVARVTGVGGFQAQAAIINYYPAHATLGPHTDHSEPYAAAPLLSFSFGQSAIFLIGGHSKASKPSAVVVHSGDVVVMSGHSRLCYHAVPRILPREEWRRARRKRRRKGEDGTQEDEEEAVDENEPWASEVLSCKVETETKKKKIEKMKEEIEECKKGKEGEVKTETKKENIKEEKKEIEEGKMGKEKKGMADEKEKTEMMKENNGVQKDNEEEESKKCLEKDSITEKRDKGEGEGPDEPKRRRKTEEKQTELRKEEKENDNEGWGSDDSKNNNDNDDGDADDYVDDLPDILEYLRTCRINMNVRQVLPPNVSSLPS